MEKAVFLDRDGVINELVTRADGRITSPHTLEEVKYLPNVEKAVDLIRKFGYKILIVTNQPGIWYGDMTIFEVVRICEAVKAWLRADDIHPAIFPTRIYDNAYAEGDYKPAAGGIKNLMKKWNIDPYQSFMIGDRWKDIVAGYNAKLITIHVQYEGPYTCESSLYSHIKPSFSCEDLWGAAKLIEAIQTPLGG